MQILDDLNLIGALALRAGRGSQLPERRGAGLIPDQSSAIISGLRTMISVPNGSTNGHDRIGRYMS